MTTRRYYRCRTCGEGIACDGDLLLLPTAGWNAACPWCGEAGRLRYLGAIVADRRWVRTEHRAPCDDRCVFARGPRCECPCDGRNHATGLTVEVEVASGRVVLRPAEGPETEAIRRRAAKRRAERDGDLAVARELADRMRALGRAGHYQAGFYLRQAERLMQPSARRRVLAEMRERLAELEERLRILASRP